MTDTAAPVSRRILTAAVVLSACIGVVVGSISAWFVYRAVGGGQQISGPKAQSGGGTTTAIADIASGDAAALVTIATGPAGPAQFSSGSGLHTGFAVGNDGLIATSAHAVTGVTQISVASNDGKRYPASIVALDSDHGIAILRAIGWRGGSSLSVASGASRLGDLAIVVGRIYGATEAGIGTVRAVGIARRVGSVVYGPLIAVDANANAVDDGAPIVNGNGDVIGVAIVGGEESRLVAAPAQALSQVLATVGASTVGSPPSFGAIAEFLDPADAALLGEPAGALIVAVAPDSAAQAGGLAVGDIVTQVNGMAVDAGHPFDAGALGLTAGTTVTLTVYASGQTSTLTVTLPSG